MTNPWLDIPLADYESHMALDQVGQAALLSDLFAQTLARFAPRSVALPGCAGGNGFEHLAGSPTRLVGIDINPTFIAAARARFAGRITGLELVVADVQAGDFQISPVDLVFAGLLFEYTDIAAALGNIRSMLLPGGTLVTVLQLPTVGLEEITPSPYRRLAALSSIMQLVSPDTLRNLALERGFDFVDERVVGASGGKSFQVQTFRLKR